MRNERGHLLLLILPLAVLVGGLILLSTTTAHSFLREHQVRRHQTTSLNEANAALAQAQARIKASTYTDDRNDVMADVLANGGDAGFENAEGNPVKVLLIRERSEVWMSEIAEGWYQLEAIASVDGRRTHVRTFVRERDPFSRFGAFVNSHPLGIAGAPKGDIHTNRTMQLFFADGYYDDAVTARDGFQYVVGATEENTTFAGGYNDAHEEIQMPDVNTIQGLAAHGDGALAALIGEGADPDDYDIAIVLNGDTYNLVATLKEDGTVTEANNLAFPDSGVIFIPTDIASLEGTLDARVTVASTGKVTLTDSIRYVDENGDPIYRNGLSTDPANEPYEPNPDYDGNAALGVVANGSIVYSHDVPDRLEINGVFFSATGAYGLPGLTLDAAGMYVTSYDSSFRKSSYRRLGGIVTDKRIVSTVVNWQGTVLSGFDAGESVYDKRLKADPPPHFLAIDRPVFRGYRIVSGAAPESTTTGDDDGYPLGDTPIGRHERDAYGVTSP